MKKIILFTLLILQAPSICFSATQPSLDDLIQAEKHYDQTKQNNLKNIIDKARSGDKQSQQGLGVIYKEGITGVVDRDKSFYWFTLAAIQQDATSEFNLGVLYQEGDKKTPPDYVNAIKWYERAANQGNIQAQVNCAYIYQFGPKEFQNINKAQRWLLMASERGDPIAHANLGLIFASQKNFGEAASHLKFAAEKGQSIGQYNYGTLFLTGSGVHKDIEQAKYWFEKSAIQNLASAQISLGKIYAWGFDKKGVNNEMALYWLNKAKDQGAISDKEINDILTKQPES